MFPKMLASEAASIFGVTVQAIHKQLKTKKLLYSKQSNRVYFGHDTALQLFAEYNQLCKVFVFVLVKGGVGKSTLCRETAIRSTLLGKKVLIIELDHQGNLTKSFNINAQSTPILIDLLDDSSLNIQDSIVNVIPGLDILPSRYDNSVLDNFIMVKSIPLQKVLKPKIDRLRNNYDIILIDCPPSLGQAVASAVLCADLIIMPTTPCDFSDSGVSITVSEVKRMITDYDATQIPMKIVLNKFDNREKDSRDTYADLIKNPEYGKLMSGVYIRKCKEIETYRRRNSTVFESTVSTAGREDIDMFTRELFNMNNLKNEAIKRLDIENEEALVQ
jgi:chromosome partitioning protein